ncbi:MAG: hypothetical protein WDW36_007494 [Sanguina aurantia]
MAEAAAAAAAAAVAAAAAAVGIDLTSPPVPSGPTRRSPSTAAGTNLLSLLLQLSPPHSAPSPSPAQRSEPPSPAHPAASPPLLSPDAGHAPPPTASQPHQHRHLPAISMGGGSSGASSGNSTPGCSSSRRVYFHNMQPEASPAGSPRATASQPARIPPEHTPPWAGDAHTQVDSPSSAVQTHPVPVAAQPCLSSPDSCRGAELPSPAPRTRHSSRGGCSERRSAGSRGTAGGVMTPDPGVLAHPSPSHSERGAVISSDGSQGWHSANESVGESGSQSDRDW